MITHQILPYSPNPMAGRPTSSGHGGRRSAAVQRLIESADQSLSLLASLSDASTPPDSATPRNTKSIDIVSTSHDSGQFPLHENMNMEQKGPTTLVNDDRHLLDPVVSQSVRSGKLHVKGVFPDQSTEFVDVEPRLTTIEDLKSALCEKRDSVHALGFAAKDARVMFGGQLVQDAWLVVDCGMGFEGAIHIVNASAMEKSFLNKGGAVSTTKLTQRTDPKLSISSISSVYSASQRPAMGELLASSIDQEIDQLATFSQALSLRTVSLASGDLLSRRVRPEEDLFAEMVADFYTHLNYVEDVDVYCEKLLSGYISVLQNRLETLEALLAGSSKTMPTLAQKRLLSDLKELKDERNTWRLLFELRQVCHRTQDLAEGEDRVMMLGSATDELRFEMLEDDAVRLLETRSDTFRMQKAVKTWLESIALENTIHVSDKRDARGSRTLRMTKKQGLASTRVWMDPDAKVRDGDACVLLDDLEDEAELLKALWLYIRAGQLNAAIDLCIRSGQSWRAASLSGGHPVGASETKERQDLSLERWGNPLRVLWKTMCWRLAEQSGSNRLSKSNSLLAKRYEELIYAALSGHIHVITKSSLCESWEDHCWAYLQGMTEQQIDDILYTLLKVKMQSTRLMVGHTEHYLDHYLSLLDKTKYLKRYQVDLDTLFEELRGSQSESVRLQAHEPHRVIQAKLITAKFHFIVSSILDAILFKPDDDSYDWELQLHSTLPSDKSSRIFLRFAAHFILFAGFTGEHFDEQAGHMIIKLYIRHLVKHRQLQHVPLYASRLPMAGATEIYIQVLGTIEDKLERELCIKRILEHAGMDVLSTVLQAVVERLSNEYKEMARNQHKPLDQPVAFDVATTEIDRKRMKTIEFLCFYPQHRAEAMIRANVLVRQFLLEGKVAAVTELVAESLPEDSIGILDVHRDSQVLRGTDDIDRAMREFLCWRAYIQACAQYDLWRHCVKRPALSLYSEEKEYVADLLFHVSRSVAATLEVLHFENGWLMGCSNEAFDDLAIRKRCLPTLVFNLHFVQLESAKTVMRLNHFPDDAKTELARPLLEKSIEVADVVADEHYTVYHALDQDQCRDLLHGFRESAVSLAFVDSLQLHCEST